MSGVPPQHDAIELHRRLCARDPTASHDLLSAYLEPLVVWLGGVERAAPPDLRVEAAEDAVLALIRNPESYSAELQTLEVYLRMSARGDLRNRLAKESKHHQGRVPWARVELAADAGKYLGRDDDPALPMQLVEASQQLTNAIPPGVRDGLSETDLRALDLILRGERRTTVFAELYGLLHLPAKEQGKQVKRHKDRLKNRLKRAGGKP